MCLSEAGKQGESWVGNTHNRCLCSPVKRQKGTEWNHSNSKPKITQEGLRGTLGNAELWKRSTVREEQNEEKCFKPRKALFRLKQVRLATFHTAFKLKAEKQQQESMQAMGQSSSFIVPREAEDMIRNQHQALS